METVTVSLRSFQRSSRYQRMAHSGAEVVVLRRGRPYLRVLPPAKKPGHFVGAGKGARLTPAILKPAMDESEWNALR